MSEIDHVMSVVPDLDRAAEAVRRVGFKLTDRGVHSGRGTANHLVVLPSCYWELLSVQEATPSNEPLRSAKANGLFACAISTGDVQRDQLEMEVSGIPTDAVVQFVRPLEIDGAQRRAAFRTARMQLGSSFNGYFFFCQHLTPDLVWRDTWMTHPNGAVGIVGLDVIATDVAATASLLSAVFREPWSLYSDGAALKLGPVLLRVFSPQAFQRSYPGSRLRAAVVGEFAALRVAVRDLHATASFMEANAVGISPTSQGFFLQPKSLGQTLIEFVADELLVPRP